MPEPVKFSISSTIVRKAVAAATARQALARVIADGVGQLNVFYDASGALHVVGDHGSPAQNGAATVAVFHEEPAEIMASSEPQAETA